MAKTIPQLTDATTVNAADELIIQQGGITKRATGAELAKGLNTINGTVNVKDFGAVADCTDQGVGTDVVPAILAAVNHAVTSVGDGAYIILPQGRYRCSSSCVINLQGKKNITIDLQGCLTSDNVAMTVFTVEHGEALILNATLEEGGVFNGWLAPQIFGPCDYTTTRDAAAAGGQEMFLLRGLMNYTVHLRAHGYAGRVLRTDERSSPTHLLTQAIKGWIHTRRNYDFSKARTVQALWADGGTNFPNAGNWGKLHELVADFDWVGPVFTRLSDIEIAVIDAAYAHAGPTFRGCLAVTGDTWYVGDTDQGAGSRHVQFIPSGGLGCAWVDVKFMRFLNKGSGLYADSVTRLNTAVHYVAASTPFTKAVELINCNEVVASISAFGNGQTLLDVSGAQTLNIVADVNNVSAVCSEACVVIASSVTNSVTLRPTLRAVTATKAAVKIDGTNFVFVENPQLQGNAGCFFFDVDNANNQVYISGGQMIGLATAYESGIRPRSVFNVVGLDAGASFSFRTNQGANLPSDGGSMEFGINAIQFVAHTPMAAIKGSLVNAIGTELQGDLKLQVRPLGAAGQTLQDGFVVSSTGNNGETYAKMLTRIAGADVEKRIKVGGTGTGPAGVGRALFVDN